MDQPSLTWNVIHRLASQLISNRTVGHSLGARGTDHGVVRVCFWSARLRKGCGTTDGRPTDFRGHWGHARWHSSSPTLNARRWAFFRDLGREKAIALATASVALLAQVWNSRLLPIPAF